MDRRKRTRYPVSEPVRVRSSTAPREVALGHIQDVSDEGIRLSLTARFPPGSTVELESEGWVVRGSVIYCSQSKMRDLDSCYSIGIKMEQVPGHQSTD
jgi:PilZ domain